MENGTDEKRAFQKLGLQMLLKEVSMRGCGLKMKTRMGIAIGARQ
jgi:hypothetical protein